MIALGTRVKFTEIAYVVRKAARSDRWGTPARGNFGTVSMVTWDDEGVAEGLLATNGRLIGKGVNKNVLALPSEGSGVVIGLERKFAGKSVAGGGIGEDWEPGWFTPSGKPIDLYVVKSELRGMSFFVPVDSLEVLA